MDTKSLRAIIIVLIIVAVAIPLTAGNNLLNENEPAGKRLLLESSPSPSPSYECTSTDTPEDNIYEAGESVVKKDGQIWNKLPDICDVYVYYKIYERYCEEPDSQEISTKFMSCPAGLCLDYECTEINCKDYDDGLVYDDASKAVYWSGEHPYLEKYDECLDTDQLKEWYCEFNDEPKSVTVSCYSEGYVNCESGKCVY